MKPRLSSLLWIASLALSTGQMSGQDPLPVLKVGKKLKGSVTQKDKVIHTKVLDKDYANAPVRGKTYRLQVEKPGVYTIELESYFVDAYLVLRAENGNLLAEDDDGLLDTHARVVVELKSKNTYIVNACGLHGETGPFELSIVAGRPKRLQAWDRRAAELADAKKRVAAREAVLGKNHRHTEEALNSLGFLLWEEGKFEEALPVMRRFLAICEATYGSGHSRTAFAWFQVAAQLEGAGQWREAELLYRRAVKVQEKTLGPEHVDLASTLNNLGLLLLEQARYQEAEALLRRALKIQEKASGPEDPEAATGSENLALLLLSQGRFEEAEPLLRRALRIREKAAEADPEDLDVILSVGNLAGLLDAQGKHEAAERLYRRALKLSERTLGPSHPDTARSLNNLAAFLKDRSSYQEAEPLFRRALKVRRSVLGPEHPMTAQSLNNLGAVLDAQGKYSEAEPFWRGGLKLREKVLGPEHPDTAESLNNLAMWFNDQGKPEEALPLLRRAVKIQEKVLGRNHPQTGLSLENLACLEADLGRVESGWELIAKSVSTAKSKLGSLFAHANEAERFRYVRQRVYALAILVSLATAASADPAQSTYLDQTYEALLGWKGQVFRSTEWQRMQLFRGLTAAQKQTVGELRAVQAALSRLVSLRDVQDHKAHVGRMVRLAQERTKLEDIISRALPRHRRGAALKVAELAAKLPVGSVLLDFHVHGVWQLAERKEGRVVRKSSWQPARVSAWILRPSRKHVRHVDLGPATAMTNAIQGYLRSIVPNGGSAAGRGGRRPDIRVAKNKSAEKLRKLLWQPLRSHVADAKVVFVSGDQALAAFPFEVLQERDGSYLIEKHGFAYLQDSTTLAHMGAVDDTRKAPRLLVMGGVDYAGRTEMPRGDAASPKLRSLRGGAWLNLPATADEVRRIQKLHRQRFGKAASTTIYVGKHATEEQLKKSLAGNQVVHLATHGFFKPKGYISLLEPVKGESAKARKVITDPGLQQQRALVGQLPGLLTGLVCAGANLPRDKKRDDGLLTAEEVAWLDLRACDLVVLSACSTALGVAREGEALMSLRRAFRQAGARTVISSLWDVPDTSTRELMQEFYGRLWKKGDGKVSRVGKLQALRGAQIAILKRNKAKYGKALPHKWGMFVLSGDWR